MENLDGKRFTLQAGDSSILIFGINSLDELPAHRLVRVLVRMGDGNWWGGLAEHKWSAIRAALESNAGRGVSRFDYLIHPLTTTEVQRREHLETLRAEERAEHRADASAKEKKS